jgi:hypothetical protein
VLRKARRMERWLHHVGISRLISLSTCRDERIFSQSVRIMPSPSVTLDNLTRQDTS